jgi:hypothetical protein
VLVDISSDKIQPKQEMSQETTSDNVNKNLLSNYLHPTDSEKDFTFEKEVEVVWKKCRYKQNKSKLGQREKLYILIIKMRNCEKLKHNCAISDQIVTAKCY